MNIWDILGIVAVVCLVISFGIGKNAIWGALTIAAIVGIVITLIRGFEWEFYKKVLIVGTLTGALFEIPYRLYIFSKKNSLNREKEAMEKRIRKDIDDHYNIK